MSNKVAFVGDIDAIKCFKVCGADVFAAKDAASLSASIEAALKSGCRIIFVLESIAAAAWAVIEKYRGIAASIIVIPDYRPVGEISRKNIKKAIVEAVGADILSGD